MFYTIKSKDKRTCYDFHIQWLGAAWMHVSSIHLKICGTNLENMVYVNIMIQFLHNFITTWLNSEVHLFLI